MAQKSLIKKSLGKGRSKRNKRVKEKFSLRNYPIHTIFWQSQRIPPNACLTWTILFPLLVCSNKMKMTAYLGPQVIVNYLQKLTMKFYKAQKNSYFTKISPLSDSTKLNWYTLLTLRSREIWKMNPFPYYLHKMACIRYLVPDTRHQLCGARHPFQFRFCKAAFFLK